MSTVLVPTFFTRLSRALIRDHPHGRVKLRYEVLWIAALATLFAAWFGYKVLPYLSRIALANDWDYHLELRWVPFYTIVQFHQLPLWNPYRCGGMPMLGHPQSALVSPFLLLDLILGPMVSMHIQVVVHIAIAFSGGCFLARAVRISRLGAIATGGCFAGSSWYYIHMAAGHPDFLPYTFVPWVIGLFYLSVRRRRMLYAALSGMAMAFMYLEAGIYAVPQTALILGLIAATLALEELSFYPLLTLALVGGWTFGFAAIKLLPTLDFFGPGGRPMDAGERNPLWIIGLALFSRNQDPGRELGKMSWGFHEYGAYIGVIFGALALWGIARNFRRGLPWLVVGGTTLALSLGYFGLYSPWVLIHKLPPFYSERIPSRFLILFSLSAAVLAGLGVDSLAERSGPWSIVAAGLVAVALVDGWLVSPSYMHHVVEGDQIPKPWAATFIQSSEPRTGGHAMYMASNANMGVIACNDSVPRKFNVHGFEDPGYRGEQYLLGPGSLSLTEWTPNALSFEVEAAAPTVLVVNQNYDHNWHVIAGRGEVFSYAGLIAVHIPTGHQQLELAFRSNAFRIGLPITLLTAFAMIVVWLAEGSSYRWLVVWPAMKPAIAHFSPPASRLPCAVDEAESNPPDTKPEDLTV